MTWPIQRQSEQFEALNGSDLRFARDHETRDLPEGLVNMLGRGVGITAGLNNPRQLNREAVSTMGMDPMAEAYHGHPAGGYAQEQGGFGPPEIAEHEEPRYEQNAAGIEADDASGYNWGPEPQRDDAFREAPPTPVQPLDQLLEEHQSTQLAPEPPDYHAQFGPHMSFMTAHSAEGGPAQKTAAPAITPGVVPGWVGHGYVPGHRVGLPWREQLIPGTVTHLDGQEVGVGWDDGQHSTEEPADLRPL